MTFISTIEELEALYGQPKESALAKEVDRLTPSYRAIIEASPFVLLATGGPEGLDCSPRGDGQGFVRVQDEKTLLLPDRGGNNRADSLRNIVRDSRTGLLFLLPGSAMVLRVNGRSRVSIDPELIDSFILDGKPPRSVIVTTVEAVYFQHARAIVRPDLWNPEKFVDPARIPTAEQIVAEITATSA